MTKHVVPQSPKKDYVYAYNNLIKQLGAIKDYLNTVVSLPGEIKIIKDKICGLTLPNSISPQLFENLNENKEVLEKNLLILNEYIKSFLNIEVTKEILEVKVFTHLIERYQLDLEIITQGLKQYCFENDSIEMLEPILPKDINARDEVGDTLLMKAEQYNSRKIIDYLLKLKANPFVGDSHGNTAFSIAIKKGDIFHAKKFIQAAILPDDDLLHTLKKLTDAQALEHYILNNICKADRSLSSKLNLTDHQAKTCFKDAEDYCIKVLGEETDYSDFNELT